MEKEEMTTATLTHRIPKESLTVKPVITFKEAVRKVNELVGAGDFIQGACRKVYDANTVRMLRESMGNYKGPEAFRDAIYGYSLRLRNRAKERREAKKQGGQKPKKAAVATAPMTAATHQGDYKAFWLSVKGIMDMPLSASKKVEVIKAIL